MRYASKVAMCRVQIPKLAYDNNTLEFWYTGNGSATFDPAITTGQSTSVIWQTSDGQNTTTTGTSHAFSYTPASGGPYRCTARVAGGLGLVASSFTANADEITRILNLNRTKITSIYVQTNPQLSMRISDLPPTVTSFQSGSALVSGRLSDFSQSMTGYYLGGTSVIGSLSDLRSTTTFAYLYELTGISPATIAHLTAIRDIRIYSMWPSMTAADSVDVVINSMWAARATYAYASGPSMQIGGTNPDPTGNIAAPSEGTDWHEDAPGHWVPLTPGAKIYDLLNDVNSEGFNTWTAITIT